MGLTTVLAVTAHYGDTKTSSIDLRVLTALAALAHDGTGRVLAKKAELRHVCAVHPNTIAAALKRLVEAEVLIPYEGTTVEGKKVSGWDIVIQCEPGCALAAPYWHTTETSIAPVVAELPIVPPAATKIPAGDKSAPAPTTITPEPVKEPAPVPATTTAPRTPEQYLQSPARGKWKEGTSLLGKLKKASTEAVIDTWRHRYPNKPHPANLNGRVARHVDALWRASENKTEFTAQKIVESVMVGVCAVLPFARATYNSTNSNPAPAAIVNLVLDSSEAHYMGTTYEDICGVAQFMGARGISRFAGATSLYQNSKTGASYPAAAPVGTIGSLAQLKAQHNQGEGA